MRVVKNYFAELNSAVGAWWNRFWFTPTPAATLGAVRVLVGALAFYAVATYAPELHRWFDPNGMLPVGIIRELYEGQRSVLDYLPASMLWPAYWASLGVIALFTVGIGGRIIAVLAAAATLSFFSRAPLVTGEFEAVLAFMLAYLCIGRASDAFSFATLLGRRQSPAPGPQPPTPSNTIALRLLQVHMALVHLMMGYGQLAADKGAWWTGEGMWLVSSRPGMSLVDLSGLASHPRIVAAWSHLVTLYLLAFPVLIWNRLARPLVLVVGAIVWASIAVASGWLPFCLAMLVGLMTFVEPQTPTLPERPAMPVKSGRRNA